MKVAALQMTSGPEVEANLAAAGALLEEAAASGARLAVLPENFSFLGLRDADKRAAAEALDRRRHRALEERRRRTRGRRLARLRCQWGPRGALRQDSSVRRRYSRARRDLSRVGQRCPGDASGAGRYAGGTPRTIGMLRREISGAVPPPERRGGAAAVRAIRVHRAHRARSLG